MNLYRCADIYDDFNVHICLKCKHRWEAVEPGKFCPDCGTKWDGEFTKRNKCWKDDRIRDWRNPGYKTGNDGLFCQSDEPRIIVETGSWRVAKLNNWGFFTEPTLKPELVWHLGCHATIGSIGCVRGDKTTCCGFVSCYESFKRYCEQPYYDAARVRLLVGKKSRIIKEFHRFTNFDAKLKHESPFPCSGIISTTFPSCSG